MIGARGPNVCTVAPGAPFLKTFARALVNGEVIAGFPDAHDPMSLAGATLYVPTRRAARALALEIARLSPARAQILPRIIPLGVMEGVENDLLFDVANPDPAIMRPFSADLPEAIGELRRRLILTQLILKWSNALRGALISVGTDGRLVENEDEPAE
jgi:ATP-dependent helicase/nuclease subunit B